ncbi:MAG: hypothetical protein ABR520_12135 [Mycobacteriales bacterium]|nr:hypothetical protein [Frankia sp.]
MSSTAMWGDPYCTGVRPGARLRYPGYDETYFCTFGFLFRGSDGATYVATSALCAPMTRAEFLQTPPEKTWPAGRGPGVQDSSARPDGKDKRIVGRWVYLRHERLAEFGLIRLERGVKASPEVCEWGGPRGVDNEISVTPQFIEFYGQGEGEGTGRWAREDIVPTGFKDPDVVHGTYPVQAADSGAPVLAGDKLALGMESGRIVVISQNEENDDPYGVAPGSGSLIFRLPPLVARAEKALRIRLRLILS